MREIKNRYAAKWKTALIFLAVAAWATLPLLTKTAVEASDGGFTTTTRIGAFLRAPGGASNPNGVAQYGVNSNGSRELDVTVADAAVPNGTTYGVFVDGAPVGSLSISLQSGRLQLRTENGQTVPAIRGGSTVEVRNGTTTVVSGAFFGGTVPTPSPTASRSPSPTVSPTPAGAGHFFAPLTGATIGGALPRGLGKYELERGNSELEVYVSQVNLPIGTVLTVFVDNVSVGQITLRSGGAGQLELESEDGQAVPTVTNGSTLQIKNNGVVILSGTFTGVNGLPPPPPPVGLQGRFFRARLSGARVTPPVSTQARGEIAVFLNQAETQATVFGGFERLSSAQTTAKIQITTGATTAVIFDLGTIGGTRGFFAPQTFNVTAEQVQQLRTGLWYVVIGSVNNPNGEIAGRISGSSRHSDFDGDGRNDLSLFRPSSGTWFSLGDGGSTQHNFGGAGDTAVSGDYDGDGRTDAAIFRNENGAGIWEIRRSWDGGTTRKRFGFGDDKAVRGDFDGDGRADIAVFRPSDGGWYIEKSDNSGYIFVKFGIAEDIPVAADLDGDGKSDISVFRSSEGNWYWLRSGDGAFQGAHFGARGDVPTVGDFDGDGKDDISVFRPSEGVWYIQRSSDATYDFRRFGSLGDIPVAGDYDGDGKSDIALFRPANGAWYIWRSVDGAIDARLFGSNGDVPTPAR